MSRKNGSQGTEVLGVEVTLLNGTLISKRDAQRVIAQKLNVTDRQARASVSSYMAEGWPIPAQQGASTQLNAPFADVSSIEARVLVQADRAYDARVENVRKRMRRPKQSGAAVPPPAADAPPASDREALLDDLGRVYARVALERMIREVDEVRSKVGNTARKPESRPRERPPKVGLS